MPNQGLLKLPKLNLGSLLNSLPGIASEVAKDAFFNGHTTQQLGAHVARQLGRQVVDQVTGQLFPEARLGPAGDAADARQDWEEWLPTVQYALINISGAPGEGKTTAACDLIDRYFAPAGRPVFAIGIPQEVLPRGWHELPIAVLDTLGRAMKSAPKYGRDPKELVSELMPKEYVLLIDDAAQYLAAGSADKPENHAIKALIDLRRHFGAICIATYQSASGVDIKFTTGADAWVFKKVNPKLGGGDRPEILRMLKESSEFFKVFDERLLDASLERGLARREALKHVQAVRCLRGYVFFNGGAGFGWRHSRPKWYGAAISQNASTKPLKEANPKPAYDEDLFAED